MVSFKQTKTKTVYPWFLFIHGFVRDAQTKMARDEWVRAAMIDDAVVVELLVGLK